MSPLRATLLALSLLLAANVWIAVPASSASAAKSDDAEVMEDYKGMQASYFKEAMNLAGYKNLKFVAPDGKKGKAKSDWVIVSTDPAVDEVIKSTRTKITAVVRKEDQTVTGIKRRDTFLLCQQQLREDYPYGAKISGGWDVTATDQISSLTGPVEVTNEYGAKRKGMKILCSISKEKEKHNFEEFLVK